MAERLFDLPETKGNFELVGKVKGMKKDKAYKEITTKKGTPMRMLNFGVEYKNGESAFLNLTGNTQDSVYFSRRDPDTKKTETKKIPWGERFTFKSEGFNLIGMRLGLKKITNEEGKIVNDKKVLTGFDSCKEIFDNLKDNSSVFTRGNLEFSSFSDNRTGAKRSSVKLVPEQISLCSSPIDFDSESFEPRNLFSQTIVFTGITKEVDDNEKATGRFVVTAKIITYKTIEDAEFIVVNPKLAKTFKNVLKPYNSIKVHGKIVYSVITEEVDDDWGDPDEMKKVTGSKREFIITGADKDSLDKETYTEKSVEKALAAIIKSKKADTDFGATSDDDWGDDDDSDDEPW